MASAGLERDLASILPRESIVLEETAAYLRDETEGRGFHGRADAVVLPGSTDEVERVLAWCYEHEVPLVPRGGGTGFAGGAVPIDGGVVVGLLMLTVLCVGLGALSYTLALAAKNQEWLFWAVQQTLLFPLLLLAGILLPVADAPGWLRFLSHIDPLTYVVDAERALFGGEIVSGEILGGMASAAVVAAVGLLVGIRAIRSST